MPNTISMREVSARMQELERQRNEAQTMLAIYAGQLAVALQRVSELEQPKKTVKKGVKNGDK